MSANDNEVKDAMMSYYILTAFGARNAGFAAMHDVMVCVMRSMPTEPESLNPATLARSGFAAAPLDVKRLSEKATA